MEKIDKLKISKYKRMSPDHDGILIYWEISDLSDINNRLIITTLSYDSVLGRYPIPANIPVPSLSQVAVVVRNIQNGGLYVCWFDKNVRGFQLGHIIGGNAPNNGNSSVFEYIV